jgi:hypothetical protein
LDITVCHFYRRTACGTDFLAAIPQNRVDDREVRLGTGIARTASRCHIGGEGTRGHRRSCSIEVDSTTCVLCNIPYEATVQDILAAFAVYGTANLGCITHKDAVLYNGRTLSPDIDRASSAPYLRANARGTVARKHTSFDNKSIGLWVCGTTQKGGYGTSACPIGIPNEQTTDQFRLYARMQADPSAAIACEGAIPYGWTTWPDILGQIHRSAGRKSDRESIKHRSPAARFCRHDVTGVLAACGFVQQITRVRNGRIVSGQITAEHALVYANTSGVGIRRAETGKATPDGDAIKQAEACISISSPIRMSRTSIRRIDSLRHTNLDGLAGRFRVSQGVMEESIRRSPGSAVASRRRIVIDIDHLRPSPARRLQANDCRETEYCCFRLYAPLLWMNG